MQNRKSNPKRAPLHTVAAKRHLYRSIAAACIHANSWLITMLDAINADTGEELCIGK